MLKSLFLLLSGLFGTAIARLLAGAGLGLASFAALSITVTVALNAVVSAFSGLPVALAQMILLSGFGTVLNMVGSAMLTRLALDSGALSIRKVVS